MLAFLNGKTSGRKLRLFAVACCRRGWHLLADERSQQAIEVAEKFADGLVDDLELTNAYLHAFFALRDCHGLTRNAKTAQGLAARAAYEAVCFSSELDLTFEVVRASTSHVAKAIAGRVPETNRRIGSANAAGISIVASEACSSKETRAWVPARRVERMIQTALIRDIFGNPFFRVAVETRWLNSRVLQIAGEIYDHRAFERVPELRDALEEAGCNNAEILNHCRGPGPHVRGCWVVDLLLGKE
jgi:hypothetical protein